MIRIHPLAGAAIFSVLIFGSARADVTYKFSGSGQAFDIFPVEPVAFQLTVPTFLVPPLNPDYLIFGCNQLDSSSNCPVYAGFSTWANPQSSLTSLVGVTIFLDIANRTYSIGYTFSFPTGAFFAPGVYETPISPNYNMGDLTVTETPEPRVSASATILAGCLLLAALQFRRRTRVTS